MPINSKVKRLYDALKADGGDVGTPEEFNSWFFKPGKEGYKNRKSVYDTFKADGADVGKNYEEFGKWLGLHAVYPTVNKYHQQMLNSVDPNKSRASEFTHRAVSQAKRGMNNVRKPVVAKVVNREGKPTGKEFAITPAKTVEDLDREYAQETTKNWENELHDQMADADKDAAKISDMFKSFIGSTDEVGSVWGNMARGGGIAGTPHSVTTNNGILENTEARQLLAAGEYNRKRKELLQLEQDSRNGATFDNHSFFRGMYDAAKDTGILTGGASNLINAGSLIATKQDLDNGVHTKAGDMLMQQAVKNSNAQSQYGDNQGWMYTGGVITTNMAPFIVQIASAGFSEGLSTSIGKVVQGAASKVALGTMKKAAGFASADLAKNIGKVTGLTTKAFGKAIQYGIVGAAQANTVGLGNVANDVINRYTGQVYQDEQGNYKFGTFDSDGKLVHEGGEDFLTALVKGEAAQTIEFATELAGGGIDAVGTALKNFVTKGGKKIINKYNMENVSKVIDFLLNNKVAKNARYLKAGADRTLGKVEVNSIVGESLEEELGIIANTVFTGDNKISDLWDEKQQSQIWGGMLLSIGLMKGVVAPFHAYNAKQYYSYKHKLNKADVNLSQLLGKEKWEELRNQIDATTNEDMPEMVNKINRDVALGKNRQPVREYIQNLLIMRGYDIGNMLAAKKAVEDKGEGVSVKNMEKNQAYQQGRDAYGYDTHEIQLDQEDKQKSLAQLLGISEQQLASMSDEELESFSGRDDNIDRAIYDYQLSSARYEGVVDNARDQIDLEVQRAAQAVDMYTDKSRNTIRNATIKASGGLEDYGVYIISGNIATHDDGSIDVSNSDDMILYYDPTTNTVEHADAMMFAELGSEENADEVRSQAMADAKEKAIKETTGIIDGVVEVGTQFKTVDADGTEHTYEVLADNGDGTAMITIDGNVPTELVKGENVQIPYSFEDLQKMKDLEDQKRLEAAKAEREQMEKERAEQQMQSQTTQAENPAHEDNIQSAPIEDNIDYSDIIREDGKVQMVDVSDKYGNNLFPDAKDVFYIQGNKMRTKFAYIDVNGELKTQSFPTGLVKIKTRGEVSVDDYKKYRNTILAAESSFLPESSKIEDNSGENRGEIKEEAPTTEGETAEPAEETATPESAEDSATEQNPAAEQTPAITLEDGTIVPMLEDGNPDFSKLSAAQTAELYDTQFDEDADGIVSGYVSDAKKALDKANNMTVKGKTFVEQKAAKDAKEKAIADAQAAYDSAIAIRDAYNERQLAKDENTPEGRKSLIEKAKRKFARLKNSEEWSERPGDLWNETVGKLLHRLYDATGIDVFDDTPNTVYEYVAANVGPYSLNYEGNDNSKGVQQETGLSRSDFAKLGWLAAEGKGMTIDAKVHRLWENRPSNLEGADTQDIRNTLISLITSGQTAFQARDYILNQRIELAEDALEEQLRQEEDAAEAQRAKEEEEKKKAEEEKTNENRNAPELSNEQQKAKEKGEKLGFPAVDKEGEPINQNVIELANWAKEQGLEIDPTSKLNSYADLYVMCKDGFGVSTLVPDVGEDINQVFYFPDNVQGEQLLKLQEEFNVGRDLKHSADMNSELTEGAMFYDGDTAREFRDFVNEKVKEESKTIEVPEDATDEKPLGEQLSEDKVPFKIEGEKSGVTYDINDKEDRKRLVAENSVDDKDVLDIDMPKHVHKSIKELCKKMGLKVQFLYMGARLNGWIENGTMYLALDANKATQFVFGHEMTHAIKQKNPEAYKELVKVAMAVTTKKKFEEDLAKVYRIYHNASGYNNIDDFVEEVIADNIGKFINDYDLAQRFVLRLNHPVLATILLAIQKIKSLLYGDFYKSVDALERIVEKAYVDTAKGETTNSETGEDVSFSLRQKPEPKKKGVGYKVFVLRDGKLYPPMVANPDGAATPVGVWLDADAAPIAGESKTGRPQVKQGGKGTQGGSGKLAYRPGWHLGVVPYAIQFNRKDADGNKTLFPKNFVFAEVEYAADVDYQEEARQEGINPSGKYQHSLAGLKHLPTDGYYMYRTNPNPETDPWVITGAMKVNRILTRAEQAELVKNAGREPQQIQEGDIVTDDVVNSINQEIADAPKFSLKVYHGSGADFTEFDFDHMSEGAGSQAFGWGGYVTSSEEIGKSYAELTRKKPTYVYNGKEMSEDYLRSVLLDKVGIDNANILDDFLYNLEKYGVSEAKSILRKGDYAYFKDLLKGTSGSARSGYQNKVDAAELILALRNIRVKKYKGNLYEVDIPDDNGSNYLDWENPLNEEQINAIRDALAKNGVDVSSWENRGFKLDLPFKDVYAAVLPMMMRCEPKEVSKFLSSLGFTGIKYPAGTIQGGAEEGDTNYVIFKPEDMKITQHTKFSLRLKAAIEETETNPSDAQKESGNYKKGHIKFGGYDYTIENPKGSTRSGKDADGKEWKITMHDTYGYIRGKFGKDGDHLDMFINDKADLDNWDGDVFVVDQVNSDGSFDEHKVMYGYDSMDDAEKAYLANYSKGWKGLGSITGVSKDEFDKWLDTSKRKLKPFADYAKVKFSQAQSVSEPRYSLKDIKPVGVGAFGNIYNQFRGNAKAAIEFLKKVRGGEAVGALHHKDIGDIDLVWGKEGTGHSDGFGLSKLVKYHPEVLDNLQEILNDMRVVSSSKNRVNLESETHKAGVRLTWDGERKSWLLTAFKKETSASDKRTDTAATSLEGDTALSQTEGSAAKIDNSSETAKENGEKFSLKEEKTLAGVHNITEEKLLKAIKQGGLANPSVAVIDSSKQNHENYGDISLILPSDKVAKRTGKNAGTWQGDAWTPTYPQVERQMSNKGSAKASKDVSSVPGDMYREVRRGLDRWLDGGEANSAMAYMFLHEKGVAPEPKKIQHKFSDDVYNELKSITAGDFNIYGIGKADAQKVLDMYIDAKFDGDKDLYEEKTNAWLERNKSIVDAGNKGGMRYIIAKDNVELYDKYGFNYKSVQTFVRDVEYDHRKTGVDTNATLNDVEDYIKTNNLTDEFNTWLEGKEKEYGIKEVIFDGFTPSGNRRYVPNTLENVSKIMKKQGRNGATGISVSFQNFAASLMPSYGTLKDIRSKKGLLTSDHEDLDKFNEKWSNVFFELGMKCQPDATGTFDDYGLARLSEAAKTSDPQAYLKKEYNVDFSDEDTKRLKEMVKAIKEESPAMYFETKFERPVGFNEFSSAVVPTTASDEVKQALQNAGVQIYEYDKEKEGDRSRAFNEAINSSDNIRFSLRNLDQDYLDAVKKGDMEKAQRLVNKAAAVAGYSTDSSYQGTSAFNGSAPWGNGYFLTKEERKEAWNNGEFEGESTLGDYINDDIDGGNLEALTNTASYRAADPMRKEAIDNVRNAILKKSKFITMYRSVPSDVREESFRNGDWVTPSRAYAVDNAKLHGWGDDYNIIEQKVPVDDVWFDGNDIAEWGYGIEKDYINDTDFAYKNTKNNRKLLDVVTYNDDGEVIPLSQRFDPSKSDVRFSLRGSTPYDKQMEEWKEKNHLEKDATPMKKPVMKEGENIFDYANRMVEWTRNQNLWKTAPKQTGFQDALDKWKADNGIAPGAYPPVHPIYEDFQDSDDYNQAVAEYRKEKEVWKTAPKPKDFDLSVDLDDMNKQLRNIRRAVLNQKNYDQRTVKAVSDLVRKMLNIGWGDGLSRGKVGNLLSAAKNATGANDVKKYLDKVIGILAENYLNRLSTAYDNLINTKGARADQSGVIKIGSLDAKGQAFMSEYKKAINMDDESMNNYIANIEEDSAKNEDNVEMNDYRLAGIQAAIMYKQQIGGNDADISEMKRQIGELKNKKDATKVDKDLLKSLEKKLFENKFDRITMYENLLNNIQRMVKESKGRAKEFRDKITEHKNEILHRANLDLEGVDSTYYDTTTAKKKFVNNDLQRAVFSSTYTFEQFLKFFGKHSANGEGRLYNYFHKLNQDALDEEQLYNEMNRNALDEKTKELFGKEKFMKLVGIDGKGMKEMDIEVTDYSNKKTGKRTIHLKQGQMLYIYLVNKETDGEMKLRAMGITEEDVAAIEENLDPRVKAMGVWLQDEYLPECQRRYQATHTKYFGAPMKEVENYFPLAINNRARNVKEDVNQDSDAMSQLAGTSTGAIVTRRVNVIPLDIENADAFEVAFNHLQEMEEWSAMLPFRQDINTLLSYTHFRNQVQNMSSVAYGSGKTLWDEFRQTAQIAAGTYKPKVNAGMMDSRIAAAMGGIAVAKISGRLWTAIKQSQSATVFLPECDFTRFVKNGVNPYGSWKWAMENIPDFRKRVENMTYGDVKLRQYLDELEKWHDWTKTISKIGMAPNILVDGITCAVGARSVYETEVNRLTKLGYPKDKADEKAYYKAVAAYNKTQQSSGGMYLSPMQVDRTYVSAALSLFKNANYAYGRMQIEACRGLARTYDFWGGKHKTTLIESMTRQIMGEDGLNENTARTIAKATYNRTFRQSIGRLINFATLVPVSWALYKVLPYLLTGDDDDKKKDMIEEAVLKGFATSLSDNYVIPFASNILNAGLKVENGKPTFDPEVFRYQNLYINPATSDLANIYSMIGNQKWYSVANKLGMLGVQSLIGFNPETVGALYQAFAEADYDNGNTAKEWQIGILKAISAPEESIRELYMDELGLKSGDIKKIPLVELEKRYAERQINRDNLLSQIGMDAETFNGYVNKYQKSFEKKIKDKMNKWDEYDKKKANEFFDTTSDPKLKDMIEKKRVKDANAAADDQITKEGLNQEKKGKEPSEVAYDAVKMSIDVAEDNAISTYNKVLNKRYAALNDEYNEQTDAMKYIFMSKHPNFKAYKDLESKYTTYGKKMKELKEKLVSADGYDAKQTILKQIRAEREKFSELQSKVR